MSNRFFGYGQKVVGMRNGVVDVRPIGFGDTVVRATTSAPAYPRTAVRATASAPAMYSSSPIGFQTPIVPIPVSAPQSGPMIASFAVPGSGGALPAQTPIYYCKSGMPTTDLTLCGEESDLKKYLLPAAIVVGAVVLLKLL